MHYFRQLINIILMAKELFGCTDWQTASCFEILHIVAINSPHLELRIFCSLNLFSLRLLKLYNFLHHFVFQIGVTDMNCLFGLSLGVGFEFHFRVDSLALDLA